MRYRYIPGTNVSVSTICIGGNIFGHFADVAETAELLCAAKDIGLNFIDTSDSYSGGLSEEYIGKAIKGNRNHWIVATKCGIGSTENPSGLGRRSNIIKKIDDSLKRLQIEHIDFYQMHHFDPDTPLDETVATLIDCVRLGKIRFLGVSNYSTKQLVDTIACAESYGEVPISSSQCHFNMFRHEASLEFLPLCYSNKVGVFAYGVLARGVLSGKYAPDSPNPFGSRAQSSSSIRSDLSKNVLEAVGGLKMYSDMLGVSTAGLAMSWVLANQIVTSAIVGLRNKSQLFNIAGAVDVSIPNEVMEAIELRMRPWGASSIQHLGGTVSF